LLARRLLANNSNELCQTKIALEENVTLNMVATGCLKLCGANYKLTFKFNCSSRPVVMIQFDKEKKPLSGSCPEILSVSPLLRHQKPHAVGSE
jgi:hypothetical protein